MEILEEYPKIGLQIATISYAFLYVGKCFLTNSHQKNPPEIANWRFSPGTFRRKVFSATMQSMAIRVVEFSYGGTKLERFLPKNQHTQRKLLNFENWTNEKSQ